jgi:hypothetical protein
MFLSFSAFALLFLFQQISSLHQKPNTKEHATAVDTFPRPPAEPLTLTSFTEIPPQRKVDFVAEVSSGCGGKK